MDNSFMLNVMAVLDRALSKKMIKDDLKSFDGQLFVKVIARLDKALSQRALKQTLKELTNLNVNVDAKLNKSMSEVQLRQQIKELQGKIDDLELRLKVNAGQINTSIAQAAKTAQSVAFQNPIEYSVQIKKDKLISDLSLLAKQNSKLFTNTGATQKYGKLLDDAYGASSSADIRELTLRMSAFKSEIKATNISGLTLTDTFKKTIGRAGELVSATSMIMIGFSQARKAYTEVKALDDQMTSLYKVADEINSRDDFPAYLDKSIRKAKELAIETKSLISSVTDWKKIGFGLGLSEELAETSTKLEKTGDMSIEKATSTLISNLQAFKEIDGLTEDQYSERALSIADKINNISNRYSIDAEGISDALQNSVAALQEANNDVNQAIAMIGAGNKIFQSPSEVGNMLKIVSMRLRGVSEDGKKAEESVAKLQDTILNLTNGKVDIMLDDNTFKSTYDILLEISKVYDTLSDKSQALLLEKISGKQRGAVTAALLQNMSEAEKIYQDALNSAGSVNKEFERYQESASAAVTRFKETLVDTYTGILNGDMIKGVADTGSAILDLSNKFNLLQSSIIGTASVVAVKGIVSIETACISTTRQMGMLGDAINRINLLPTNTKARKAELLSIGEATKGLSDKQNKLLLSNKNLETSDRNKILQGQGVAEAKREEKLATMGLTKATDAQTAANVGATTSTFSLKAAVTGLGASMKAAFMSNPIGISFMALSIGVGAIVGRYQEYRQELEETRQKNIEAADSAAAQVKKLEELYIQYFKLSSATDRTASQEQELKKAVESMTVALGDKAKVLEGLTVGTDEYAQALRNATQAEMESQYAAAVRGRKSAAETLENDSWSNWSGSQINVPLNVNMTGVDNHVKSLEIVRDLLKSYETETSKGIEWQPEDYKDMDSVVEYYYALIDARECLTLQSKELNDDTILESDIYKNMDNAISKVSDSIDIYTKKKYEELKMEYEFHNGIPSTVDGFNTMKDAILNTSGAGENLKRVFNDLLTADFSSLAIQAAQIGNPDSKNIVFFDIQNEDIGKLLDEYQKRISTLSSAMQKVKEDKLTGSDLLDLQQEFPELINETDDLSTALNELVDKSLANMIDTMKEAGASDNLLNTLKAIADEAKGIEISEWANTVTNLGKLDDAFGSLGTAYENFIDKDKDITFDNLASLTEKFKDVSGIENYVKAIQDAAGNTQATQKAFDDLTTAYIYQSGILSQVNDGNAVLIQSYLEEQGVVNANVIVHQALSAQKEYTALTTKKLADATSEDIVNFLKESDAAEKTRQAIVSYYLDKEYAAGIMLDTSNDVLQLMHLVEALGGATGALQIYYSTLSGNLNAAQTSGMGGGDAKYIKQMAQVQAQAEIDKIKAKMDENLSAPKLGVRPESDKKKGSKTKKDSEKEFDWIERKLQLLNDKKAELEEKVSSSAIPYLGLDETSGKKALEFISKMDSGLALTGEELGYLSDMAAKAGLSLESFIEAARNGNFESKQGFLSQSLEIDKQLLQECQSAVEAYQAQYNEAMSKLPEDLRLKVETGGDDIQTLVGGDAEKVQAAIDAREKLVSAKKQEAEVNKTIAKTTRELYENEAKYLDSQAQQLENRNSIIKSQISYMETSGQIVNATTYENIIANLRREEQILSKKLALRKKELQDLLSSGDLKEGSSDYYELQDTIAKLEEESWSLAQAQEEYNNQLLNLPIQNAQTVIDMYKGITDAIQNWGNEMTSMGRELDAEYYQMLIRNGATVIEQYKKQAELISDVMSEYDVGSTKWNELYSQLQNINSEMSSMVQNLAEWNKALLEMPLTSISNFSGDLNKVLEGLNKVKDEFDTVISAVTSAIQKEKDALADANEATNKEFQSRIEELQSRLDLLRQQNKELNLQTTLEKALYDLQTANTQKTEKVVREGEIVYEHNKEKIRSASEAVADALKAIQEYNIEKEIQGLQDELKDVNDAYNEQLEILDKIAEKWSQIKSDSIDTANANLASGILGEGWKDKLLSGNDSDIYEMFKNLYQTNSEQINQYKEQIESTENIYALLQEYIIKYQEGTLTYEQAQAGIQNLLSQMNGKMSAMDNLQNIFDYLGTVNGTSATAEGVLEGIQKALEKSAQELLKSLEQYNENAGLISEYTTSWKQLTSNVSDMKNILQDVVDVLEDGFNSLGNYVKHNRDEDEDLDDDRTHSSGTVSPGGTANDHYGGNDVNHNTDQDPNHGPGVSRYAKGILNGAVGGSSSDKDAFDMVKYLSTHELKPGERPVIAHDGEAILNKIQQLTLSRNMLNNPYYRQFSEEGKNIINAQLHDIMNPSSSGMASTENLVQKSTETNVEVNFNGDMELPDVTDPTEFARAFARLSSPIIRQELGKIR